MARRASPRYVLQEGQLLSLSRAPPERCRSLLWRAPLSTTPSPFQGVCGAIPRCPPCCWPTPPSRGPRVANASLRFGCRAAAVDKCPGGSTALAGRLPSSLDQQRLDARHGLSASHGLVGDDGRDGKSLLLLEGLL